jgi:hypothetical protein
MAVWVTKGMRLLGTPLGNSPIRAEGWAPMGLKYLSTMLLMGAPLWM